MRNDVLDNLIKLAQEKKSPTSTELLYRQKIKKFKNIIEEAHPEKAIVQNSYDPIQGLVENENERQNIIINILQQPHENAQLINKKYSETQLLLSLLKVANTTENDELKTLAYACKNQIEKKAYYWLVGTAIATALLYAQQHFPKVSQGFELDYRDVAEKLKAILDSDDSNPLLFGQDWSNELIKMTNDLLTESTNLYNKSKELNQFISKVQKPKDSNDLLAMSKNTELVGEMKKVFDEFKKMKNEEIPLIQSAISKFTDKSYKAINVKDKGYLSYVTDAMPKGFMSGGWGLFSDKLDDAAKSLKAFSESLDGVSSVIDGAIAEAQSTSSKLQSAQSQSSPPSSSGTSKPDNQEKAKPVDEKPVKNTTKPKQKAPISLKEIAEGVKFRTPPSFE